jgi:2,4-dienoyl-CoA reductase-like NADH-dependent reductase (Old Yellow Enzyme family)
MDLAIDRPETSVIDLRSLFAPLRVLGAMLANRIVMSPMTREVAQNGVLAPQSAEYYASRARLGVGLIITEATTIDHEVAHYTTREPYMFGPAPLASWRSIVEAVHREKGVIFPQLWHTGLCRVRHKTHNPDTRSISAMAISSNSLHPAGPSSLAAKPGTPARAATENDLRDVVVAFGQAAREAKRIGFDGIAIHGAHGYLIHQFAWERSNWRTDLYGGSLERRARLAVEVVREMRRCVGPGFPIMFRFSQWAGWDYTAKIATDPGELERFLLPLADAGVDIFDASTRRFWLPEFSGSDLNLAGWAKKITGRLTMTVGSVGLQSPLGDPETAKTRVSATTENIERLMHMLHRGDFDLVGIGRALLANPDWVVLARAGRWSDMAAYDASATGRPS